MRDPFTLDPVTAPEGVNAAELLMWRGRCPWCALRASFSLSEENDGSLICRACGVEFLGPVEDRAGQPPQRAITAVYVAGNAGMRTLAADALPAVSARP